MQLSEPPRLMEPTVAVRDSWLAGERADCAQSGASTELLDRATQNFELVQSGGQVGYNIATPWRRQGHATRMLAAGLTQCRRLGLRRILLTCAIDNEPSRRVILANGGIPDGQTDIDYRFRINLDGGS